MKIKHKKKCQLLRREYLLLQYSLMLGIIIGNTFGPLLLLSFFKFHQRKKTFNLAKIKKQQFTWIFHVKLKRRISSVRERERDLIAKEDILFALVFQLKFHIESSTVPSINRLPVWRLSRQSVNRQPRVCRSTDVVNRAERKLYLLDDCCVCKSDEQ